MLRARRLQREATAAERKLWQQLQGKRLTGLKFRLQHHSSPYFAAFCCLKPGLIIEHDGGTKMPSRRSGTLSGGLISSSKIIV
jgi:very-short-patch-repair endonuclease